MKEIKTVKAMRDHMKNPGFQYFVLSSSGGHYPITHNSLRRRYRGLDGRQEVDVMVVGRQVVVR